MLSFCGIDRCSLDASGRLKLSPRVIGDFRRRGSSLVFHCLPEGAIALYPEDVYLTMRSGDESLKIRQAGESAVMRRAMRRFGAMTQSAEISPQGRITLPEVFREYAGLMESREAVVAGVEIGVEVWAADRWALEQRKIAEYMGEKEKREMEADLAGSGNEVKS